MNRRQFLTGVSAAAVASALPAAPAGPTAIAWDLASGPDYTALWIMESTPHGFSMWRRLWESEHPEYKATFIAPYELSDVTHWLPTFSIKESA